MPDDGRGVPTNFVGDIQYTRNVPNRLVILSVGGTQNGISLFQIETNVSDILSIVLFIFLNNLVVLMD